MSPADITANEHLAQIIQAVPFSVGKEKFRVFLFGPALGHDEIVAEPGPADSPLEHARFLRYYVAQSLRESGWIVDFGESSEVETMWTKRHTPMDSGLMEYEHALTVCGAVVILPSSPGSFCEMGLFASSKDISNKTLAVVHDEFERAASFFRKGLIRVFQARGGETKYKPYRDKVVVLDTIREFVEDRFNRTIWDNQDITTGKRRLRERKAAAQA